MTSDVMSRYETEAGVVETGIDALDFVDVLDGGWDCVVWDPPYFDENNPDHVERFNGRKGRFNEQHQVLGDWDKIPKILELIKSKMSNGYIIYFDSREDRYDFKYKMIWDKGTPSMSGAKIYAVHEWVWLECINIDLCRATFPYILRHPLIGSKSKKHGYRIAMKPKSLFLHLFDRLQVKHILDPFAGKGKSIEAAMDLGLKIDACDLDNTLDYSWFADYSPPDKTKQVDLNSYF